MMPLQKPHGQEVMDLAQDVERAFTESDWKDLAQRIGFRGKVDRHPRLLPGLQGRDPDYPGHVLDMVNEMVNADGANIDIIRAKVQGDETAFFSNPGRFKKGELLGEGGYGQVFREVDTLLDMEFARKELRPSVFVNDEVIGRFLREARILFKLSHPNIVGVRDVWRDGRSAYIRMDLFEGKTLDTIGQVDFVTARGIVGKIGSAVAHAHSRGVVHRDLKPSNVLVLGADVRVIDFGMAAFVEADLDTRLTRTGTPAGGSYCAPELKQDSKKREPRCDVFSVGALWFHLVTGRDPSGTGLEKLLEGVGDLPSEDRALIVACMSSTSEERPRDGADFINQLHEFTGVSKDPVLQSPRASNELPLHETRLMAAFASASPFRGATVSSTVLWRYASTVGLNDELRFGLALASLEAKNYLSGNGDSDKLWSLTATGSNWIAANVDAMLRLRDIDEAIPF